MPALLARLILFLAPSVAAACREIEDDRRAWANAEAMAPVYGRTLDEMYQDIVGRSA